MARILDSVVLADKKVRYLIMADIEEYANLEGNLRRVRLFAADACDAVATIRTKGSHHSIVYVKIPEELAIEKEEAIHYKLSSCIRLLTNDGVFYIHTILKKKERP